MVDREELARLIEKSKEIVDNMTPEEKDAMIRKQAQSWARAEMSWPKPKFHYGPDGTKIYDSYEDYCND